EALPGNAVRSTITFERDEDFDGSDEFVTQTVNAVGVELVRDVVDVINTGALTLDYTALNQADTLTLQDDVSPTLRVTSTGTAPVQFARKEFLVLNAGDQDDQINLVNTVFAFALNSVTVNAGGGNDTINVERTLVPTSINGEDGTDTINVGHEFGLLHLTTHSDIAAPLIVVGGLGGNTLNVTRT